MARASSELCSDFLFGGDEEPFMNAAASAGVAAVGLLRLGRRLKTSCRFPRMAWLTGSSLSITFWR